MTDHDTHGRKIKVDSTINETGENNDDISNHAATTPEHKGKKHPQRHSAPIRRGHQRVCYHISATMDVTHSTTEPHGAQTEKIPRLNRHLGDGVWEMVSEGDASSDRLL